MPREGSDELVHLHCVHTALALHFLILWIAKNTGLLNGDSKGTLRLHGCVGRSESFLGTYHKTFLHDVSHVFHVYSIKGVFYIRQID